MASKKRKQIQSKNNQFFYNNTQKIKAAIQWLDVRGIQVKEITYKGKYPRIEVEGGWITEKVAKQEGENNNIAYGLIQEYDNKRYVLSSFYKADCMIMFRSLRN